MEEQRSPAPEALSLIVADADPLSCALLAALLNGQPDFRVLATCASQDSLLSRVRHGGVDVALVGVDLADGPLTGLMALKTGRELDPQLRVVLLLNHSEPHLVLDAMRGGSRGVFSRSDFQPAALFKCIRCVHQGQIWLNTQELGYVLSAWSRTPQLRVVDAHGLKLLSHREEEVVGLVVEGLGNREIAQQLNLSEHTVRNYLFKIFDKLGVSNRVELVLYATSHPRKAPQPTALSQLPPRTASGPPPAATSLSPLKTVSEAFPQAVESAGRRTPTA
ncbi:MAG TPA: response regulator transcription factor [Terriglobales bacterium]|nr:response regulator transcription factor [Terriglobales bacterium]